MAIIAIGINENVPIFTEYFHALTLTEPTDIFNTGTSSFMLEPRTDYEPYDVIDKLIKPLINATKPVLKADGAKLLVPMEGALFLPDPATTAKYPLLMIGHGNHAGYAVIDDQTHKPAGSTKGTYEITVLDGKQVLSYAGYLELQKTLAEKGIASYSINLNIVNTIDNNEHNRFIRAALDFNQRILLFFHHLKLLKILVGEAVTEPTGETALPLKFLKGTTLVNLRDELAGSSPDPKLDAIRAVLADKIDFTKLGFMGHSRGADTVARIPAYFHKGTPFTDPVFPKHSKINERIKNLSVQIGSPLQQHIKCILSLEPTATKNDDEPAQHGYIIDNQQTMFFVGVGTHDEDVSLDPVRIYEFPTCPKAMIAINGASHKRFNSEWAKSKDPKEFSEPPVSTHLLDVPKHEEILSVVFGSCFTATMGNQASDFLFFTKERKFPIKLSKAIDVQCAWEFGFPFGNAAVMNDLDTKVTALNKENLSSSSFAFEQGDTKAFLEQRENAGTFTIQIPLNPSIDAENLSKYTHFSFRFARGYKLDDKPERTEVKNFTIEFFENDTLLGKTIGGKDIATIELKAVRAFDEIDTADEKKEFKYSILLQTAEISLRGRTDMDKVNRIEIKVIPDETKSPPRSGTVKYGGSIAMGVVGAGLGIGGAAIYNKEQEVEDDHKKYFLIGGGVAGAALGSLITYFILSSDENAFAFTDFLLTNRQFP
jgi:hypothetical protein